MTQTIFGRQRKREIWWLPSPSTDSCYRWQHWKIARCNSKRPKVGCSSSSWGSQFGRRKCSTNSKGRIEHENSLCKNGSKTAARWAKEGRKELCLDLLQRTENEPDLLNFIITCGETWVFTYDLETKRQSMQWKSTSSPRPKKSTHESFEFQGHADYFLWYPWYCDGRVGTQWPDGKSAVQWRPLIIIADNVINRLLLSKSVVPKHSI